MRKYIYIFIILLLGWKCSSPQEKQNAVYFYNDNTVFKVYDNGTDSLALSHIILYEIQGTPIKRYILDTILIAIDYKSYDFIHLADEDTIFYKSKSYLSKIDYSDTEWLKNEDNLSSFWSSIRPWEGGRRDTLNIFVIESVKNTDSLIFRQVHRWYVQP